MNEWQSEERQPIVIKGQSNGWTFVAAALVLFAAYSCAPERGTVASAVVCGFDPEACERLVWLRELREDPYSTP